jgi:hypothetical protein
MSLYQHLHSDLRSVVDALVDELGPQPWPIRFLALLGLLSEKLEASAAKDQPQLIQQWAGLVTATLERLPPDSSVIECLGLMSISFNGRWRAQALAQIERDPKVLDRLINTYPAWDEVVESVLDANEKRPIRKQIAL